MCECYKIGGPWIAEDPDCPVHGTDAQRQRDEDDMVRQTLDDRITFLEEMVERQDQQIKMLQQMISQTGKE